MPLVLQFHGYPGASRSFAEQASFAGMGMALIAMDCPGQAGYSEDVGGFLGTTVSGHIIAGLDGPPERMYYVRLHQNIRILCRLVRELDGVKYYNDSIGTSPTRTIAGLRSFDQKIILIAGGYDKKIPYEPLAPEIVAHVKVLVLMGATAPRIEKAVREDPNFDPQALPILHADSMQHAVELARGAAKPGDIVSLSPASASFDLYPNFEVRGRDYKRIVNELQ